MEDEQTLIDQASTGDIQAFQSLVEAYSGKLYVAAYRILGNKEHAEDCIQEVFLKLHRKIGTFNNQSKFSTWIYQVTVNTAIDLLRKHAKHQNDSEQDLDQVVCHKTTQPEQSVWLDNISAKTHRALMMLSEEVRLAFILRHHEDRSIKEISEILEVNPNTVKNRIYRAIARLREILDTKVIDYETVE
ncbi:MAG: RNA polymerase sigma factor [Kangiellaceae bacterium]|nr:RNA polymerase sigma factor [Kangiellaceae bacterium]